MNIYPSGSGGSSGGGSSGNGTANSPVDHIAAGTAAAATVTAGSFFCLAGFTQAAVSFIVSGSNLSAGDIQAQFSNDAGVTISSAFATIVSLTGGAAETKTFIIAVAPTTGATTAGGTFCNIRLANGTGTFASTTVACQVVLT